MNLALQPGLTRQTLAKPVSRDFYVCHPSNQLAEVLEDVLAEYKEESFYFLNENALRRRASLFRDYFLPNNPDSRTAYAIKAAPKKRILEILIEEGLDNFDCASPSEIALIKSLDASAETLYNHPIKRATDIQNAAQLGARHFTVQTKREVDKILSNALVNPEDLEIAVRFQTLNDDAEVNLSKKFGAEIGEALEIVEYLKKIGAAVGLSFHTGSQNKSPETFKKAINQAMELAVSVGGVRTINLGGGFPVNYLGSDTFNVKDYLEVINKEIDGRHSNLFDTDRNRIIIEPGRAMIGEAVDLIVPVLSVEERADEKRVYIYDGRFTSFSPADPPNARAEFKVLRQDKNGLREVTSPLVKQHVFGRTCDSADDLGYKSLPETIQEGDWIWHQSAGAYTDAYASSFNSFGMPKWISYNS